MVYCALICEISHKEDSTGRHTANAHLPTRWRLQPPWTSLSPTVDVTCCLGLRTRGRLRSASSSSLIVRCTQLSTVDDRAFPVAAARVLNQLLRHVTSAPSHHEFSAAVKHSPFQRWFFSWLYGACEATLVKVRHVNHFSLLIRYLLTYFLQPHVASRRRQRSLKT